VFVDERAGGGIAVEVLTHIRTLAVFDVGDVQLGRTLGFACTHFLTPALGAGRASSEGKEEE